MIAASVVADELTVLEAANLAIASHLHLVIDVDGQYKLTPILLPGMHRMVVVDKAAVKEAA